MKEFKLFVNDLSKDWTLFLDRDGVINKRLPNEYVKSTEEFEFIDGVIESLTFLSTVFGRIIVVTNQQGIGKKQMTESDLLKIHNQMITDISKAGGRIDKVYFCPELDNGSRNCRKPNSFMAYQAKNDFPEIDFPKSVMVGDSESDIEFGKRLEMITIYLGIQLVPINTNYFFDSLLDFTKKVKNELTGENKKGGTR